MDELKLRVLLLGLGIITAILNIIKTTLDIIEKLEAKRKAQNRKSGKRHKRK